MRCLDKLPNVGYKTDTTFLRVGTCSNFVRSCTINAQIMNMLFCEMWPETHEKATATAGRGYGSYILLKILLWYILLIPKVPESEHRSYNPALLGVQRRCVRGENRPRVTHTIHSMPSNCACKTPALR